MKLYSVRIYLLTAILVTPLITLSTGPANATKELPIQQVIKSLNINFPTKNSKFAITSLAGFSVSSLAAIIYLALQVKWKNQEIENGKIKYEKDTQSIIGVNTSTNESLQTFQKKFKELFIMVETYKNMSEKDIKKSDIPDFNKIDKLLNEIQAILNEAKDNKIKYKELVEQMIRIQNTILPDDSLIIIPENMSNGPAKNLLQAINSMLKKQQDTIKKTNRKKNDYKKYIKFLNQNKRDAEYEEAKANTKQNNNNTDIFRSSRPGQQANVNHPFFEAVNTLNDAVQMGIRDINPMYKYISKETHNDNVVVFELQTVNSKKIRKTEFHLQFFDNATKKAVCEDDCFHNICLERAQSSVYKIDPNKNEKHVFIFISLDEDKDFSKNTVDQFIQGKNIKVVALFGDGFTEKILSWLITEQNYTIESFAPAGLGEEDRKWMKTQDAAKLLDNVTINYNLYTDQTDSGHYIGDYWTNRFLQNNSLENKQIVNVVIDEINNKNDTDGTTYIDRGEPFLRISKNEFTKKAFYAFPGLFYRYLYHFKIEDIQLYTNYRYTDRPGRGYIKANIGLEGRKKNERGYLVFNEEQTAEAIKQHSKEPNKFTKTDIFTAFVIDAEREKNDFGEGKFLPTMNQNAQNNIASGLKRVTDTVSDVGLGAINTITSIDYGSYGKSMWNNIPSFDDLRKTSSSLKRKLKEIKTVNILFSGDSIAGEFNLNDSITTEKSSNEKNESTNLYPNLQDSNKQKN